MGELLFRGNNVPSKSQGLRNCTGEQHESDSQNVLKCYQWVDHTGSVIITMDRF